MLDTLMLELETRFRMARPADAGTIVSIVNAANKGDVTHSAEIASLLAAPGSMFLLRVYRGEVAGCVYLKKMGTAAFMTMLAVRPALQGAGVGREIVAEARRIASEHMRCELITQHHPH